MHAHCGLILLKFTRNDASRRPPGAPSCAPSAAASRGCFVAADPVPGGSRLARPGPPAHERRSDEAQAGRRHSDLVWATLVAALPHELRRSLGVISLLTDDVGAMPDAGRQIALEVRRIDRLIDAMTEVSRVTANGDGVAVEPLAPSRVISSAVVAFARDPDRCEVSVERDEDLPPVRGSAVLTEMILLNLLSNASRYGDPPVVLAVRRAGTVVEFAVHDAGGGFTPRQGLPVATTSGAVAGAMGVGLAISRLFASAMGGWLDVESGSSGSRVSLCLPVARGR